MSKYQKKYKKYKERYLLLKDTLLTGGGLCTKIDLDNPLKLDYKNIQELFTLVQSKCKNRDFSCHEDSCKKNLCKPLVYKLIETYMRDGWHLWVNQYNKYGKERTITGENIKDSLILLGDFRKYIVNGLFEKCKETIKSSATYNAFGSTNPTSDYDLTIIGPKAPEVMIEIFNMFAHQFGHTLTEVFDTNLYVVPMFSVRLLSPAIDPLVRNYTKDVFVLSTPSEVSFDQYAWASIKLLHFKEMIKLTYTDKKSTIMRDILDRAQSKLDKMIRRLSNQIDIDTANQIYPKEISKCIASKEIYTRYQLYYIACKDVLDILYDYKTTSDLIPNLFEKLSEALWFSIESYFTVGSVNIVVIDMQAREILGDKLLDIHFTDYDYICAVLENLGDLLHHMTSEYNSRSDGEKQMEQLIIKYSKYILRIYYSCTYLTDGKTKEAFLNSYRLIKRDIIPLRASTTIDDETGKIINAMNYNPAKHHTCQEYLQDVVDRVIPVLIEAISPSIL